MPDIIATVGAVDANSLVTQDFCDEYFDERLNADAWTGESSDDTKARAMIMASRIVSAQGWMGTRVDDVQALALPRTNLPVPDAPDDGTDHFFAEDEIPLPAQQFTCELILMLLQGGATDILARPTNQGVIKKKTGVLETTWAAGQDLTFNLTQVPLYFELVDPLLDSVEPPMTIVVSRT